MPRRSPVRRLGRAYAALLIGVTVGTKVGVQATLFYLAVYTVMNLAAFGVIVARQAERPDGDDIGAYRGLGTERPLLAWPLTLALLGLAGFPLTAGFIGKFSLIQASVEGDYTWLGVMIVIGSMISLGYYLPVIAAMWMRESPARPAVPRPGAEGPGGLPAVAGGSSELDAEGFQLARDSQPEIVFVAVLAGAATLVFGIVPQPLFDLVQHTGSALGLL